MALLGECPGASFHVAQGLPLPETLTVGNPGFVFKGNALHASHNLAWHRGMVFCWKCGFLAAHHSGKLTLPCRGGRSAQGQSNLNRIREGKCPSAGGWPEPEGAMRPKELFGAASYDYARQMMAWYGGEGYGVQIHEEVPG